MPATQNLTYDLGSVLALDAALFTKSVDSKLLTVTATLTTPIEDAAGDIVHSEGGNFAPHEALPWVGLEHYRWHKSKKDEWVNAVDQEASDEPVIVAWARDSKEQPGGKYGVRLVPNLEYKGKRVTLPVATSYFDEHDSLSMQVFAMVADDSLPGVSMEFKPAAPKLTSGRLLKSYSQLGPSPIENRPALEIFRWDLHGFVHCRQPVNEDALTVTKAVPNDKLIKAVESGKIGSEVMHPMLMKSLAGVVPVRKYFTVPNAVPSLRLKAMPDDSLAATSVYDNPDGSDQSGGGNSEYPTADGLYSMGQAASDASETGKGIKGEHKKGLKAAAKIAAKFEALAQECIAAAKNIEEDLEDDGEGEVEPTEEESAEVDTERDDDGVMKCIPARLKTIFKARRFSLKEIQAAERGDSAEDIARRDKARRQMARTNKLYG